MPSEKRPAGKSAGAAKRPRRAPRPPATGRAAKTAEAISRVRELAWAGQHARAIELASQGLTNQAPGLPSNLRAGFEIDLLDLRAESHIAVGRLELAAKDAHEMVRLANRQKSAKLKAQALNRKAVVEMRQGDLKSARKTAASGLRAAKQSKQKALIAESYYRLSEAQWRLQENEAAIDSAQKAIALYEELEDTSGTGRAFWSIANAYSNIPRAEDVRNAASTALNLCERAGDQYGIGNALNALTLVDADIAQRIEHAQQARQAFESAGYADRQNVVLGNLAVIYFELGLYPHARRLQAEVVEINRAMGTRVGLTYSLGNLIDPEITSGDFQSARMHLQEYERLVADLGDPTQDAGLAAIHGNLAFAEGNVKAAIRHYRSALKISETAKLGRDNIFLTELGRVYLADQAPAAALKATARAASLHRAQGFAKPDSVLSQAIWWRHAQALNANKKTKEARESIDRAFDFLIEAIQNIRDVGLRRNYLNKVEVNRELIQFWVKEGPGRKLPKERIFSYLNIESSLREPFKRLADTGLRLNTLHTAPEIQTFLVEEATELIGGERVLLIRERDGKLEVANSLLPRGEEAGKAFRSSHKFLAPARLSRTAQLTLPARQGLNRIVAPLIAQNQMLGYLYVDMDSLYGRFDETDRDMLGMLANQGAVALDNAQWAQGLEKKVEERTEELQARLDELAIINSVQAALAAKLDLQGIYNLIGDKIQQIFDAQSVLIGIFDHATRLRSFPYNWEKGEYHPVAGARPFNKLAERLITKKEPIIINQYTDEIGAELGLTITPGTESMKSGVFVPLIAGDVVTGVISLQNIDRGNAFSDSDVRLLQTLSNSMSVALQNAQSFKAEQERVAELQIINSIQQGLAAELDFQAIVDLVGDKLREVFQTGDLGIDWYDEKANLVHYLYLYEHGRRLQVPSRAPTPDGILDRMRESRGPIVLNSPADYARFNATTIPGTEQGKSYAAVPIISSDRVLGDIGIENYEKENAFGEAELRLLTTISASLGTALENARLFDETQRLLKETEQRNAELAIINSIQAGLVAKMDIQGIYDLVGDKLRDTFEGHTISIWSYERQSNLMHAQYMTTRGGRRLKPEPYPLTDKGFNSHVMRTRQPLFLNEDLAKRLVEFKSWTIEGGEATKSGIWVPLIIGDEARGVISVQNLDHEHAFNESDFRLLTTLASSLSVALENARLFDETQRLLKITEDRAAELAIINSIQEGLASKLEFQSIIDLVGDKILDIFKSQMVGIMLYDEQTGYEIYPYLYERGRRLQQKPIPHDDKGFGPLAMRSRQPVLINSEMRERMKEVGSYLIGGEEDAPKSAIYTPLLVAGESKGVITIGVHDRENAFSDADVRLLQTLANAMSVALENARLFDETQRLLRETEQRNAELAIINSVQAGLVAKMDIQGIYDLVGDKIRDIFDAQAVLIAGFDLEKERSSVNYGWEKGTRFADETALSGLERHIIRTRQMVLINDHAEERVAEFGMKISPGTAFTKSLLFVPMIVGGTVRGMISLQNVDHENAFSDSDVRLLTTLTNSMSVALENARLFDETQRLLKITEDRAGELAIINSVQQGLASKLEFQAIIDLVGDKLGEVFNSPDLNIRLYDSATNMIRVPYLKEHGERIKLEPMPMGGLAKHVIETRQVLVINEDMDRRAAEINAPTVAGTDNEKSLVAVPIITGDQILGLVNISNFDKENAFSESDVRLLTTVAASLGVALENARLFDETQRLLKETEQRAAELAIINSVQEGLASKLDMQAIYDLVGDKIREIFETQSMYIAVFDHEAGTDRIPYDYEEGERFYPKPTALSNFERNIIRNPRSVLINEESEARARELGMQVIPGTEMAKSGIWVPLVSGNVVRGMISIQNLRREHAYADSDLRLLQTLANSMSVALENARLFDETQRLFKAEQERAAELAIINSIQQGLASKLDLQAIVDLVGDKLREVLNTNEIGIRLYDEATDLVRYLYEFEHGERLEIEPQRPSTMIRQMIADQQPIFGSTRDFVQRFNLSTVPGTETSKAIAVVPIIAGSKVIGAVSVESFEREDYFNEANIRLMQTIATSMGVALESARLFDETTRLLKETEERNAELAVINSVQQGVAASLDFQTIIDLVGDKLREVLKTGDVGIRWFDYKQKIVHYMYEYEHGERLAVPSRAPVIGWEKLVQRREPLVRNTAAEVAAAGNLPGTDSSMSNVAVPIVGSDRVIGSIIVEDYEKEYAFSDSDVRLLTTVASSMGVALENARLFDETQRLLKETEERNAELAVINSVQAALAAELNIQGIYDAVGDKIREIFHNTDMNIRIYDPKTNLIQFPYMYENGERLSVEPQLLAETGFAEYVLRSRETVVINQNLTEEEKKYGSFTIPGTEPEMAVVFVPLVVGDQARGLINLASMHENAFSDSDVRLLQTLANSMSVALENARLFAETQRLLKITEERAEELAIINSVQAGLASQLDIQAIFDLVGDKVRDTFDAQAVMINTYDRATNLLHYRYIIEKGQRQSQQPLPLTEHGFGPFAMRTRQPLMINENLIARAVEVGSFVVGGGEMAKSGIWVPLVIGGEARGVISIQNIDRENAFSDSDFRLLTTLASSLSVAFENARLFDETQRLLKITEERAEELAIINSVQAGLASKLDIQAIFDLVGDKIRDTFDAQSVGIYTYDRGSKMLHFPYVYEKGQRLLEEPRKLGKSFSARVIRTRKPLMINEKMSEQTAKLGSKPLSGTEAPKSGIWVPLVIGDEARGVISIQNVDREQAFSDSDFRLLTTLASSLSVAFENARLFSETQRLLKETEQRNAELAIINKVQQGLASKLEMQAIYDLVGDEVRSIFDAQSVLIVTYDKGANLFHYPYNVEKGERYHVDPTPPMGVSEQMIKTRQPVLIRNEFPKHYQELTGRSLVHFAGEEPKSWLGVPLLIGNEVRGTISLQNVDREEAYGDSDLRLLSTLAGTMSVALENARLFDETQRLLKETEQRAAELAIINSVQEGLASKLEMQLIYDLVGDKVCEIFNLQTCFIMIYDRETETENYPYIVENGVRLKQEPIRHDGRGFGPVVMRTRQPMMINERMEERSAEVGSYLIGGSTDPKSAIYVPLLIGSEAKGVISVQNIQRENAFSESDLRLLTTLASSMSVALESARLFAETEQRAAQLAIINSVQQGLASKLEMQTIYELVGEKLRELFDMQAISLVSFDLERHRYHYHYLLEKGQRLDVPEATITPMGELIIRTRKTLLVNESVEENLAKLGVAMQIIPGTEPTKALLRVPILIGGKVSGFIGLSNLEKENAFSESDVRLLETLASSLSVALESARLFEETKRNAAELATVNMVSSALASELDISTLIQLVGEQIRAIFRAEIAYVALLDEARETINFPYQYGEYVAPMRYGEGLTSKIIQTAKPLLINAEVNREAKQIGATFVGLDVQSYLGVPIMVGGNAVGVVSVQSTSHEDAFDENDQRLLGTIAANVGSALHNAQLYKEAQESRAAAEEANKAKSTFLANMSHELRTPLNAIIGFTRIVRRKADGALPDKQLENLDKVLSSSEHLLGLINTVLDIAKIEAGRMDVIPANFNIAGLAETCANLATPLLKPSVSLEKRLDESLGLIYSDQDKIKQIVINLLSNAAKFTHAGKIVLSVVRRDEDTIDIAVADSGIGISEEALGRIFEEFQQADTSTTRQYGGTGLGLAISRSLARLLGGDLTATSELGKGSTFTLTLPIKYGARPISPSATPNEAAQRGEKPVEGKEARKTVLLIDDDPDAVYLLQESLSQEEFNVIGTRSGYDGLQVARDQQPDAILLDILMPEVDGWQVLNDLKEDPSTTAIPVILLTIVDKKALGFRLGATAYLLKPLDPAAVLETLRRVIGDRGQARKHALVVDDDPTVAEMLRQILPEPEFELESAEDGEAGLQAIEARRPDIILLDLIMPKLDGFGVIERLRADPGTRDIPIIVISAKELTEEESKKLRATVAFVMKKQGFDSQKLMQELNEAMHA